MASQKSACCANPNGIASFMLIFAVAISLSHATEINITVSKSPKIVDFVDRLNHPEGTSATFTCSIGSGELSGLTFEWFKNEHKIVPGASKFKIITQAENYNSILRIADLNSQDTATYSCLAKNQFGQDKISTKLFVKVQLKWVEMPPPEVEGQVGKSLRVPCKASGQPAPTIEWVKLTGQDLTNRSDNSTHLGSRLHFESLTQLESGLYECRARNGLEKDLLARVKLNVLVPARFQEKFSVVQAKGGESAKLECNATGDQPLTVNWFKEDTKLSKRGGENFEIYETTSGNGVASVLVIRTVGRADGLTYKCVGENEYGNDERLIKLLVVEVPSRPMNVRVKDAWSRSASLVWSSPFTGNSPITSYVIQYWRKNSNDANGQNHRRQEFTVSGTQTSALITNLMPALTYEASVIAENQVGRSEPSENVVISTGEDEPTSAPSDVTVESRGPSTIRVTWKVPPSETWNGKLLGFYVGFRPRGPINNIDVNQLGGSTSGAFSYRTIDYIKGQQVFETFLTNLMRGHEYEVVVKAFNSVGSGPESHLMAVRTFDGDLPASPSLFAHQTTHSSISLRWTYPIKAQSLTNSIKRYVLYYQRQGDDSWLEIGIPVEEKLRSSASQSNGQNDGVHQTSYSFSESGTTSYLLSSLDPGFTYKIYVVAVNNFGMGDPSNIVTTKTEQINGINESLRSGQNPVDFNLFEMNKQIQFFMVVPIICTIVLVIVIVSAVLYCSRRIQHNPTTQHVVTNHGSGNGPQPTGTWGPDGAIHQVGGHRYVDFDKGGILKTNGPLLTNTQGSDQNSSSGHGNSQNFSLPYGTMPMNSVIITDQKSWDRQSSNAPLKPLMTHIYDSPI